MTSLHGVIDHPWLLVLAVGLAIVCLIPWFKLFFGDCFNFGSDVADAALPDLLAALMGRFWKGEWAEVKLLYFGLLVVGVTAAWYHVCVMVLT